MNVDLLDLGGFHVTGIAPDRDAAYHDERCLRPALFASYADLSKLRYDYPLVLVEGSEDEACVRSLSSIVEEVLREIAPPGVAGEARRRQVLNLEEAIRANLAKGRGGTLSHLWDLAEAVVVSSVHSYLPLYMVDHHDISPKWAGMVISIIAGTSVLGAPLAGDGLRNLLASGPSTMSSAPVNSTASWRSLASASSAPLKSPSPTMVRPSPGNFGCSFCIACNK